MSDVNSPPVIDTNTNPNPNPPNNPPNNPPPNLPNNPPANVNINPSSTPVNNPVDNTGLMDALNALPEKIVNAWREAVTPPSNPANTQEKQQEPGTAASGQPGTGGAGQPGNSGKPGMTKLAKWWFGS